MNPCIQGEKTAQAKKDLRGHCLGLRAALSESERAEKSRLAAGRIAGLPEYRAASLVMIYRATPEELDLQPLTVHPASAGKRFAYPVCLSRTEMAAMIPGGWRRGSFGIWEPDPACSETVAPEQLDLVICPGAAFDSGQTRLGMGGGYYDRFLPRCTRALIWMAAFDIQYVRRLPREATDIVMQKIITESCVRS